MMGFGKFTDRVEFVIPSEGVESETLGIASVPEILTGDPERGS